MSTIDPIDSTRIGPVERIPRPVRHERRDPGKQEHEEPREPEQDEGGDPAGSGHVDIRV